MKLSDKMCPPHINIQLRIELSCVISQLIAGCTYAAIFSVGDRLEGSGLTPVGR